MKTTHCIGFKIWRASIGLRLKFSHSRAERDRVETLLTAARFSNGGVGYGQVLPRKYLTGETIDSALEDIRLRWWPALEKTFIDEKASFAEAVEALAPLFAEADAERKNASYAGVDVAALGAFAAGSGRGGFFPCRADVGTASRLPLVGVISADSPAKAAWTARALRCLGYRRFKVKIGRDRAADEARLQAVRRVAGTDAWLAVDANGAWEYAEAEERMRELSRFGVALVEEPLTAAEAATADFSRLEKLSRIPIMVDESLCTLTDAAALISGGAPSWWNVRLAKNGGFAGWRFFSRLAAKYGINVYGGILVGETSALAAAARGAWFAEGRTECGEYGFPRFFLRGDPFRGGPGGFRGAMSSPGARRKGLGITLCEKALAGIAQPVWSAGDWQ